MDLDKRKIRRFALLARMREAEHRSAASQATQAITMQNKQTALAGRALSLSQTYDKRRDAESGLDLSTQKQALSHTRDLARQTNQQAAIATSHAGQLTQAEQHARQKRDHVRDHYEGLARKHQAGLDQKEQMATASSTKNASPAADHST